MELPIQDLISSSPVLSSCGTLPFLVKLSSDGAHQPLSEVYRSSGSSLRQYLPVAQPIAIELSSAMIANMYIEIEAERGCSNFASILTIRRFAASLKTIMLNVL